MAQFDVHELRSGRGFVIDCQADLHRSLPTRFVVPLVLPVTIGHSAGRLVPQFEIQGRSLMMATNFAATIAIRELGPVVTSLSEESHRVVGALDVLIAGF